MPPEAARPGAALRAGAIEPDWAAPRGVGALMTTRAGGVSGAPWDSLNLGAHVGDDMASVVENRRRLAAAIGAAPVYLRQVHGAEVVVLTAADAAACADPAGEPIEADAAVTCEAGVACVVQVADCLPVLFAADNGRAVGAAHAGWRGLAAGIVEHTLRRVCSLADCAPREMHVWLGPCIGPRRFEVGADVLQAFGSDPLAPNERFVACPHAGGSARWLADLAGLARDRLAAAGAVYVSGGRWCTAEDASRFFSFRRDGVTGRHVAAVWRRAGR
jgi:YfiH family protein